MQLNLQIQFNRCAARQSINNVERSNCGDAHADNNDSRAEPKVSDAGSIRERREEWAGMCAEEEAH